MNLTIDIGNTLIKMAVFDGGEIVEKLLAEECDTKLLDGLLARWPAIDRAIIASTGGRTAPLARMLRVRAVKCLEFTPATPVPIRNGYDTPETLGADRLAAAVGAALVAEGRDALVVDFGTAITVDYVSGDGTYRGGAISPGMGMRFQAAPLYGQASVVPRDCRRAPLRDDYDLLHRAGRDERHRLRNRRIHRAFPAGKCGYLHNFYRWRRKKLCEKN